MRNTKTILVCTVGGSHAPILAAIKHHAPSSIHFVCSSGKRSSAVQITGVGNCIKASPRDENPTLPNIPAQLKLRDDQYEVIEVPADDPDAIHQRLTTLFDRLSENSTSSIIADYTGGTKSMTAALLLAALECDNAQPYMVTGQRENLSQVTDGTEIAVPASVERIRFRHQWSVAIAPWKHFGYSESATSLEAITCPADPTLRDQYLASLAASRAFAAWDRFDHKKAYKLLKSQGNLHGQHLATLGQLDSETAHQEPMRLLDLRLNMLRKAQRHQFDDAVGRAYRLLEWTAQWLLKRDAKIDTGNVPKDKIPEGMTLFPNEAGHYKAGLHAAWELLERHGCDEVKSFAASHRKTMREHLTVRNNSILAHGFDPIEEAQWSKFHQWMDSAFFELLENEAKRSGVKSLPMQLPTMFQSKKPISAK